MKDYYDILGVARDASPEEIKKAYRKRAYEHHPDRGGEEAKFKELNEAYQTLSNEQKRRQYDQFGSAFESGTHGSDSGFGGAWQGGAGDLQDIFEQFFAGGARTQTRARAHMRGSDVQVSLHITLEDAYAGVEKEVSFATHVVCERCEGKMHEPGSRMKKCPECNGSGHVEKTQRTFLGMLNNVQTCSACSGRGSVPEKPCSRCRGRGRVSGTRTVAVRVPAGVANGDVVRVAGGGEAGEGASSGDLFVRVNVTAHHEFTRRDDNLYSVAPLTFSQAALGGSIKVKTMGGPLTLKVPAGIQSGELLRLSGKGMPRIHGRGKGDQYVKIEIETPQKVSARAKELIERLREEGL